jgi:hypothetical protein
MLADLRELDDREAGENTEHRRSAVRTVSKLFALELLGLALSEKQIPQLIEIIRSVEN